MYSVYKHTTPSGKVYIGITSKPPEKRWLNGRGYRENFHFFNAIKKFGWNNIQHEILAVGLSKAEAEQMEISLIAQYDSTNQAKGYNFTNGGQCVGTLTEKQKQTISRKAKEAYASGKRVHHNLGKKLSEEIKSKLKEWHSHKTLTEEHRKHIGDAVRGKRIGGANPMARAVVCVETGEVFSSIKEAADSIDTTRVNVSRCVNGRNKTAGGYRWQYTT